tara:strand:- start:29 stop:214 length:186 start_codon:yes stop_codon:yes gene_type:complete
MVKKTPPEGGGVVGFGLVVLDFHTVNGHSLNELVKPLGVVSREVETPEQLTTDAIRILKPS